MRILNHLFEKALHEVYDVEVDCRVLQHQL